MVIRLALAVLRSLLERVSGVSGWPFLMPEKSNCYETKLNINYILRNSDFNRGLVCPAMADFGTSG